MQDIKRRIDRLILLPTVIMKEDMTQIQAAGGPGSILSGFMVSLVGIWGHVKGIILSNKLIP